MKQNAVSRVAENEIDYTKIAQSKEFKQLLEEKKKFIMPLSIFFFCFYIALPIMTSYSKVLNTPAVADITWAWIFAFAQFVMTWGLCMLYSKKASSFDRLSEKVLQKIGK
jgi:uncharacterized membrane protein (DUF485 family)